MVERMKHSIGLWLLPEGWANRSGRGCTCSIPWRIHSRQERLDVQIAIRTGPAEEELVRYTDSHNIDLAILQASPSDETATELARALLDRGRCALLVLR
jgi:hypothetical protein